MNWQSGNYYFFNYPEKMENNALLVYQGLSKHGWTMEAIAGTLGNMYYESSINPGIWQNLDYGNRSGGYGLIQWTPATKYINWAGANWESNHWLQIDRLHYESTCGGLYWIRRGTYTDWSYEMYRQSTEDPYLLACVFAWCAEGSAVVLYGAGSKEEADRLTEREKEANREALRRARGNEALKWYEFLKANAHKVKPRRKLPVWMMCRPIIR